ncbi:MAG: DUF58 domain-containing protein, partial [Gammaproteobacteria bacterium]
MDRLSRWSEDRFTRLGRLLALLLFASIIFATDPSRTQANVAVAVSFAFLAAAALATLRWRARLRVVRELPGVAQVDVPLTYRLHVSNDGQAIASGLEVRDRLALRYPSRAEFATLRALTPAGDNWVDRKIGFLSWMRAVRFISGAVIQPVLLPRLASSARVTLDCTLMPLRRGTLAFSHVEFARPDPFGLLFARRRQPAPQVISVVPRQYPMPGIQLPRLGGQRHDRPHLSGFKAGGQEFHALREFRAGDSVRHIHWRVSAKRGAPIVKQFVDGSHQTLRIVVDAYALAVPFERLLEATASVIAAFGRTPAPDLELCVVEPAFDPRAERVHSGSSRQLIERLAHLKPATMDVFDTARHGIVLDHAVIFLTTRWDRARRAFAEAISARSAAALSLVIAHHTFRNDIPSSMRWIDSDALTDALVQ